MTKYKLLSASSSSSLCVYIVCDQGWGGNSTNRLTTHYDIQRCRGSVLIFCLTNSSLTTQQGFIDFFFLLFSISAGGKWLHMLVGL